MLLLACARPVGDTGQSQPESCSCWPVCAGVGELQALLGWLKLAELVHQQGAWYCRCAGSSGQVVLLPVELEAT